MFLPKNSANFSNYNYFLISNYLSLTALLLIISIASIIQADDQEISIECTIGKVNYIFFNQLLSCTVKTSPNIMKRDTKVTSICGSSSQGVKVFYAVSKVIRYIPKNLEQVFEDLIGFRLESTQLKMVTKEDLQPFPELLMFSSVNNHVEFLEEDLFMYNTKLEYVSFRYNKITYIHPNVFNAISRTLKQLYMDPQSINCLIGNPTTPAAIEKALAKFATSQCTDILNAPALYTLWLELKAKVAGGNNELETCNTGLQTCNGKLETANHELDTVTTDLEAANSNLVTCNENLEEKEAELVIFGEITAKLGLCCDEETGRAGCN